MMGAWCANGAGDWNRACGPAAGRDAALL